jgi:hypothetical protein
MYIRTGLSWASWLGEPQTTGWRPGTLLSCPVWGGGGRALNQTESSAAILKKGRRSLTWLHPWRPPWTRRGESCRQRLTNRSPTFCLMRGRHYPTIRCTIADFMVFSIMFFYSLFYLLSFVYTLYSTVCPKVYRTQEGEIYIYQDSEHAFINKLLSWN